MFMALPMIKTRGRRYRISLRLSAASLCLYNMKEMNSDLENANICREIVYINLLLAIFQIITYRLPHSEQIM